MSFANELCGETTRNNALSLFVHDVYDKLDQLSRLDFFLPAC